MHSKVIRDIKAYRNEPKDVRDVELANSHLKLIESIRLSFQYQKGYDPVWYPKIDTFLRKKHEEGILPIIYLNARFSVSDRVKQWIKAWNNFSQRKILFNESDFFFTFEFFRTLDYSLEKTLLQFISPFLENKTNEDKTDIYFLYRICFSDYMRNYTSENKERISQFNKKHVEFLNTIIQ
jgi:hypothetical protein